MSAWEVRRGFDDVVPELLGGLVGSVGLVGWGVGCVVRLISCLCGGFTAIGLLYSGVVGLIDWAFRLCRCSSLRGLTRLSLGAAGFFLALDRAGCLLCPVRGGSSARLRSCSRPVPSWRYGLLSGCWLSWGRRGFTCRWLRPNTLGNKRVALRGRLALIHGSSLGDTRTAPRRRTSRGQRPLSPMSRPLLLCGDSFCVRAWSLGASGNAGLWRWHGAGRLGDRHSGRPLNGRILSRVECVLSICPTGKGHLGVIDLTPTVVHAE